MLKKTMTLKIRILKLMKTEKLPKTQQKLKKNRSLILMKMSQIQIEKPPKKMNF